MAPGGEVEKSAARSAGIFANNAADALRLKTILALQSAGILDSSGRLTDLAIKKSDFAMNAQGILRNPSVIRELTKDGSEITDWVKMKTDSFKMPTGQSMQVHFYKNKITGEINYTHPDFKVKGQVNAFSDSSNFEISIKNITI